MSAAALIYAMPRVVLVDAEWAEAGLEFDFEFVIEVLWYPPRVPAYAASPILEFV